MEISFYDDLVEKIHVTSRDDLVCATLVSFINCKKIRFDVIIFQDECVNSLKRLQNDDLLSLNDISWNFVITKLGVFEGRGWRVRPENPELYDSISILVFTEDWIQIRENTNILLQGLLSDGKVFKVLSETLALQCVEEFCNDLEWDGEVLPPPVL